MGGPRGVRVGGPGGGRVGVLGGSGWGVRVVCILPTASDRIRMA